MRSLYCFSQGQIVQLQHLITPYAQPVEPFVWWDNEFSDEQLDWLQDIAKRSCTRANVGGTPDEEILKQIRRSQVTWLNKSNENAWLFERLAHVVSSLNSKFYQFDLVGFGEAIQLTNYDQSENGMYGWHQDYGGTGPSRKLSIVMQLSDPEDYEGGCLQIQVGGEPMTVKKKRGLIVAFPSYVLHQVTPVTRGNRQSLVAWITGPAFK